MFKSKSLWHHPDFLKFWAGQSVSMLGSAVSFLAIPSTAILTLNADPLQLSLLTIARAIPVLLFGLYAGAWVDRLPRRPVLIMADYGHFILFSLIPLAYVFNVLHIALLYLVAFLGGMFTSLFNTASGAYLPSLVSSEQLVEGNSKISVSQSVSEVIGPGIGGTIIQFLTAPIAILIDAFSFLVSALFLTWIRHPEKPLEASAQKRHIGREMVEGLSFAAKHPVLRALLGSHATIILFNTVLETIFLLYLTKEVGISIALFGLAFAIGSIGTVLGALLARYFIGRLGIGMTMVIAPIVMGTGDLLMPLTGFVPLWVAFVMLILSQFSFGMVRPAFGVSEGSLRQTITPNHLLGRVNACKSVLVSGVVPLIGALLGGVLGQIIGLQTTLFLVAIGEMSACLWLIFSPVKNLQTLPPPIVTSDE